MISIIIVKDSARKIIMKTIAQIVAFFFTIFATIGFSPALFAEEKGGFVNAGRITKYHKEVQMERTMDRPQSFGSVRLNIEETEINALDNEEYDTISSNNLSISPVTVGDVRSTLSTSEKIALENEEN